MAERLINQVAYITGAASGIGLATATLFAHEGARVIAVDIDQDGLQKLTQTQDRHSIATAVVDIRNPDRIKESLNQTQSKWGPISILVNSAAVFDMRPLTEASDEDRERSWQVNVAGTQNVTDLVAAAMIEASVQGSIVHVSSVSGMGTRASETVYSETKAALLALTRDQARTLSKSNIRVNTVSPGPILTPASQEHADQIGIDIETFKEGAVTGTLIGRMGTPEEVAKAILFLTSPDASYITGANLVVDGGLSLI
jgi:NAD(P)-dependent dehydrogenase (short-subunit alcohol dehydrogenase family)